MRDAMAEYFNDPVMMQKSWDRIIEAQQRLINGRDPFAFDLLSIAKESLKHVD